MQHDVSRNKFKIKEFNKYKIRKTVASMIKDYDYLYVMGKMVCIMKIMVGCWLHDNDGVYER